MSHEGECSVLDRALYYFPAPGSQHHGIIIIQHHGIIITQQAQINSAKNSKIIKLRKQRKLLTRNIKIKLFKHKV